MCNTTKAINSWQKKAKPHHLCRYLRRLVANTDDDCGKKRMARRKNKLTLAINHTSQTDFHAAKPSSAFNLLLTTQQLQSCLTRHLPPWAAEEAAPK